MKKLVFALVLVALLAVPSAAMAGKPDSCTTIQSGELYGSDGSLLTTGYNEWGYNYQARMFNGMWCDYHPLYRPGGAYHDWCLQNYGDVELIMKWNDAWLSNKDCDADGLLDRHYGYDSYIGSGAWLTNHMSGGQGKDHWTYFTKIVAAPADAEEVDGIWYTAGGTEIGPEIWGDFATIQEVESGSGVIYLSPAGPGLGNWQYSELGEPSGAVFKGNAGFLILTGPLSSPAFQPSPQSPIDVNYRSDDPIITHVPR